MLSAIWLWTTVLAVPPVRLTPTKREPVMALRSTRLCEDSTRPMPVKLRGHLHVDDVVALRVGQADAVGAEALDGAALDRHAVVADVEDAVGLGVALGRGGEVWPLRSSVMPSAPMRMPTPGQFGEVLRELGVLGDGRAAVQRGAGLGGGRGQRAGDERRGDDRGELHGWWSSRGGGLSRGGTAARRDRFRLCDRRLIDALTPRRAGTFAWVRRMEPCP